MNERIRELAEQAGAEIYGHPDYATICVNGQDADALMKKFAELIVRECGILADQYQFEKKNPNPLATERLPLLPSDFIYEHFGVE